jgi:hypothetical protein
MEQEEFVLIHCNAQLIKREILQHIYAQLGVHLLKGLLEIIFPNYASRLVQSVAQQSTMLIQLSDGV